MYPLMYPLTPISPTVPTVAYTSLPRELLRNHLINYSEPTAAVPPPPLSSPPSSSSSSSSSGQKDKIQNNVHPPNPQPPSQDSKGISAALVEGIGGIGPSCSSCGPSTYTPRARKPEGNDPPGSVLLIIYTLSSTHSLRKKTKESVIDHQNMCTSSHSTQHTVSIHPPPIKHKPCQSLLVYYLHHTLTSSTTDTRCEQALSLIGCIGPSTMPI